MALAPPTLLVSNPDGSLSIAIPTIEGTARRKIAEAEVAAVLLAYSRETLSPSQLNKEVKARMSPTADTHEAQTLRPY